MPEGSRSIEATRENSLKHNEQSMVREKLSLRALLRVKVEGGGLALPVFG